MKRITIVLVSAVLAAAGMLATAGPASAGLLSSPIGTAGH